MKTIIYTVATFACACAFAQNPQAIPGPAKGSSDRVLLLDASQMPLPPPANPQKMQRMPIIKADDGFSSLETASEHVRQFMSDLDLVKGYQSNAEEATAFAEAIKEGKSITTVPIVVNSLDELKLCFNTIAVRRGKLIGASPQGTLVNGKWSGVERYFYIEGAGYWRVSETDMAASGGMFYMKKTAINTTVGGKPAISIVMTDDNEQRVEEVLWVNGGKLFKVTYAPEQQNNRYGKMKMNSSLSAVTLAKELQ